MAILAGWIAAYGTRAKKLPKLDSLIRPVRRERRRQTPEEQLRVIQMITAALAARPEQSAPQGGR